MNMTFVYVERDEIGMQRLPVAKSIQKNFRRQGAPKYPDAQKSLPMSGTTVGVVAV